MPKISLELSHIPPKTYSCDYLEIMTDGLGQSMNIPVMIARGAKPGPVLGFTAAVHGNELNGIRVIHQLFRELQSDLEHLRGTVLGIPVVNGMGLLLNRREFSDGADLNRTMPGKEKGKTSQQFVFRFLRKVVRKMDYLIDLHTASFGRVNSLYVRANMENPIVSRLAHLQHPQIIVHNPGRDGSLRGAAEKFGIPAITVEVGNPQRFQQSLIRYSLVGIHNILSDLKMLPIKLENTDQIPIVCRKSYWIHTDRGGLLEVKPETTAMVKKGEEVAILYDVFGRITKRYRAPEHGVVVGKSVNPVSPTGARILHLGIPVTPDDPLAHW